MSNWSDPSWKMRVGVNHTPAYQVSGRPFAKGGIDSLGGAPVAVNFPYVTRWVQITNHSSASVKVGFGPNAFIPDNKNYFTVAANTTSERLEVKISRIYLNGGSDSGRTGTDEGVSVVAGLTSINVSQVNPPTGSRDQWHLEPGNNISWSGSYNGVG